MQSRKDTKVKHPPQPQPVHPVTVWQKIQMRPLLYHQTTLLFVELQTMFHYTMLCDIMTIKFLELCAWVIISTQSLNCIYVKQHLPM